MGLTFVLITSNGKQIVMKKDVRKHETVTAILGRNCTLLEKEAYYTNIVINFVNVSITDDSLFCFYG